jgi:hypothetical protein
VVSLTAVFLALAIGLVVGTAALNGPVADQLNNQVNALTKKNQTYRDQVTQLQTEAGKQEEFANEAAPGMLQDKLLGRRVLVVSMQSTSTYVDDVVKMLALAGAKVTGRIEVEDKFTDPANNETLLDLCNTTSLPVGLTNLPANSNGVETASFLLASVLLDHNPVITSDVQKTVVTAFKEANFIVPTGDPSGTAEAVIFLAAQPYTDREADSKNANELTLAEEFEKVGPEVVAADGAAGAGNVISSLRGDPTLQKVVTTVDNLSTPQGRVALPLALNERLVQNKAGHYGVASGATAMIPKLQQ